jgi:hypothetical protein
MIQPRPRCLPCEVSFLSIACSRRRVTSTGILPLWVTSCFRGLMVVIAHGFVRAINVLMVLPTAEIDVMLGLDNRPCSLQLSPPVSSFNTSSGTMRGDSCSAAPGPPRYDADREHRGRRSCQGLNRRPLAVVRSRT